MDFYEYGTEGMRAWTCPHSCIFQSSLTCRKFVWWGL